METKRELLIKEAIKRGYKKGAIIKSLYDSKNYECSGLGCFDVEKVDIYYYDIYLDNLWVNNDKERNILIYKEGEWAKIISYKEEQIDGGSCINDFKTPKHYDNSKGSIYQFCENQNLNSYEFDIIKRVVRSRKKGNFKEDLEKTKHLIDLYLKEYEQGT